MDRVCIAMPDLNCHNDCGKVCTPITPKTLTTTTAPACTTCYDCEWDEVIYAFWGTLVCFWITHTIYRNTASTVQEWYWTQRNSVPYSQLVGARNAGPINPPICWHAIWGFGLLTLFTSLFSYYVVVSLANYTVVVLWQKKEMCLKVYDFQTALSGTNQWQTAFHWSFGQFFSTGSITTRFACFNDVCPDRLLGLVVTTWLSLWMLFGYWSY